MVDIPIEEEYISIDRAFAEWSRRAGDEFSSEVEDYQRLQSICNRILYTIPLTELEKCPDNALIVAQYIKALHSYRAILVLLLNCLHNDAVAVTRCLFENLINIKWMCKTPDGSRARQLLCQYYMDLNSKLDASEREPEKWPDRFRSEEYRKSKTGEYTSKISALGGKGAGNLKSRANDLELDDLYNVAYFVLSSVSHTDVRTMDMVFTPHSSGTGLSIDAGPRYDYPDKSEFESAMRFIGDITVTVMNFFGIPEDVDISKLCKKLNSISNAD